MARPHSSHTLGLDDTFIIRLYLVLSLRKHYWAFAHTRLSQNITRILGLLVHFCNQYNSLLHVVQ